MELNNYDKLQILTAKTWDLHVRINEKIRENGFSFCNHCSNHGRNCVVLDTSMKEKENMIDIRDSLQQLHNVFLYLQRVRSRQEIQRNEALARLKESREILIERLNQIPEKERKFDVVEEVIEFIGDGKTDECPWHFQSKIDKKSEHRNVINGISNFLVRFTRFGLELAVIFASIYASVELCRSRQQNHVLKKEAVDARILATAGSDIKLDVLRGRG